MNKILSHGKSFLRLFKRWLAEQKNKCTLDTIYFDESQGCWIRHRDKNCRVSELPSSAVPVTKMRKTFAVVSADAPEPAPYGQNAITLFVWSEDFSFEKAFEHLSDDNPPIDWQKILIVGAVIVVGLFIFINYGGVR